MIPFLCTAILIGLLCLPALLLALSARDLDVRPNVGATVHATLQAIDMSHKEAALIAGMDFAQWSRGVNGLGPLDLHKLARLPWRFQALWIQKYVRLCVTVWLEDARADAQEGTRCGG